MEAKVLKSHKIQIKNHYLDSKTFKKILVWSFCVTFFSIVA